MMSVTKKRIEAAVLAIKPIMPSQPMIRIFLQNQGWTATEIDENWLLVATALGELMGKGKI